MDRQTDRQTSDLPRWSPAFLHCD